MLRAMRAQCLAVAAPALAGVCALLGACGPDDSGLAAPDASAPVIDAAAPAPDAPPGGDDVPLSWVDFAIAGCEERGPRDGEEPWCRGTAPLSLHFVALTPASIDVYRWSFGDGEESQAAGPKHTFAHPGRYDISLTVAGPGGTAQAEIQDAVGVTPAPLGAACEMAAQCGAELCLCSDDGCAPPLDRGLCTEPCGDGDGCDEGVCADLAAGQPDDPEPWQATLCLPECEGPGDCSAGEACLAFPAGDGADVSGTEADGWIRGCFAKGPLAPIGGSCRDGGGAADDGACASGTCLDEGARGMCSASCEDIECPAGAACATFQDSDLGARCVHRCDGDAAPCDDDPWLACEDPDQDGDPSFSVNEEPAPGGYCAPKRCEDAADCGTAGACDGGYCGPA